MALFGEGAAERGSEDHSGRLPPHALVSAALSPLPLYLSSFLRHTPTVCTQHVALLNIYVYTHPYTYIVWSPFLSFFLRNKTIEIIPQQMSEMYYCKVYFFYNIVYKGIGGDGLPVSRPVGLPGSGRGS